MTIQITLIINNIFLHIKLLLRKSILMSQMAQFLRKISWLGNLYIPYVIVKTLLTYAGNKCKNTTKTTKNLQH